MHTLTQVEGLSDPSEDLSAYQAKKERVKRSLWAQAKLRGETGMGQDSVVVTLNSALGFASDGRNGGKVAPAVRTYSSTGCQSRQVSQRRRRLAHHLGDRFQGWRSMNQLSLEDKFAVEMRSHLLISGDLWQTVRHNTYFWLQQETVVDLCPAELYLLQFSDGGKPQPKLLVDYRTMPAQICHAAGLRSLDNLASTVKAIAGITHIRIEGCDGIWEMRWEGSQRVLDFVGGAS
jgi:hypothetical protein